MLWEDASLISSANALSANYASLFRAIILSPTLCADGERREEYCNNFYERSIVIIYGESGRSSRLSGDKFLFVLIIMLNIIYTQIRITKLYIPLHGLFS